MAQMTAEQIQAESLAWQQDIDATRTSLLTAKEKALSTARAKGGARGIKKGTASWDALMQSAAQEYDVQLAGLAKDELAYQQSALAPVKTSKPFVRSTEGGGNAAAQGPAPGAGYSGPTTEFGKAAQEVGRTIANETMSTAVGVTTTAATSSLGKIAGPMGMMASSAVEFAMMDEEEQMELEAQTIGKMGVDKGPVSNLQGFANMAAFAVGLLGPINSIKSYVAAYQLQQAQDAMGVEGLDAATNDESEGSDAATSTAETQSDMQAAENEAQNAAFGGPAKGAKGANESGGIGSGDSSGAGNAGSGGAAESDGGGAEGADGADGNGAGEGDGGANGGEDGGQSDGNGW